MPTAAGPNTKGQENLVFGYDLGDVRNSYRGEPTENLTTDTPSQYGWMGTYSVVDSASKTFTITTRQDNAATTSAWRSWYWSVSSYIGSYVTISADVELVSETNCTFSNISIGQGNTGAYPYHIAGSNPADKVTVSDKPVSKIHMTWSGVINATGIVGFTQWISNVTANGANAVLRLTNIQIEAKSHETPFVNGTRSSTQGLLDLTGDILIDISNVSFDSNAHPDWDGANDYIALSQDPKWFTNEWAYEFVFKSDTNTGTYQGLIWAEGAVESGYSGYQKLLAFYNHQYFHYRVYSSATGGWQPFTNFTPSNFTPTNYNHIVWQFFNGTTNIAINGEIVHTNSDRSTYDGGSNSKLYLGTRNDLAYDLNGQIPYFKRYSRLLTAEEIKSNFNAIKGRFNI
jgi:hypothetical protein